MSATYVTTPIGAVIGLAIARKGIPTRNRGLTADLVGLGLGAGAGYVGGSIYDQASIPDKPEGWADRYGKTPHKFTDVPTTDELNAFTPKDAKLGLNASSHADRSTYRNVVQPRIQQQVFSARIRAIEDVIASGRLSPADLPRAEKALQSNRAMLQQSKDAQPGILGQAVYATGSSVVGGIGDFIKYVIPSIGGADAQGRHGGGI